jgi:hypothetical protein
MTVAEGDGFGKRCVFVSALVHWEVDSARCLRRWTCTGGVRRLQMPVAGQQLFSSYGSSNQQSTVSGKEC